jgi:hypothetical protein
VSKGIGCKPGGTDPLEDFSGQGEPQGTQGKSQTLHGAISLIGETGNPAWNNQSTGKSGEKKQEGLHPGASPSALSAKCQFSNYIETILIV